MSPGPREDDGRVVLPSETGLKTGTTGAQRSDAAGKGRLDLFPPPWALLRLSQHAEEACQRGGYAARNWEKGIRLSRYYSSAARHLAQWWGGLRDEPHLVAAAWNVIAALETQHRVALGLLPAELNDRPAASLVPDTKIPSRSYDTVVEDDLCGSCTTCGNEITDANWVVCPFCGSAVRAETGVKAPSCPACHLSVHPNAEICHHCGYPDLREVVL